MTNAVYDAIIKPFNQCGLMGIETVIKSEIIGPYRITLTRDSFKQYRATVKDRSAGHNISAILFDKSKTIRFKYTVPDSRGMQLTRQLFVYTEMVTKRKFYHSDNLTIGGKASN